LVMISWVIFRSENFGQMGTFLRTMFVPKQPLEPNFVWVSSDIVFALAVAYFIIFLPLVPRYQRILSWYESLALRRTFELAAAYGLFVFALARIATSSFQAFIYFRF
jgi:hypothetical protein